MGYKYTITECLDGYYGQDCANECQCENEALCDFRTGSCNCTAGWMGEACNESKQAATHNAKFSSIFWHSPLACTDGFYGRNCSQVCNCIEKNQNRPCNRINGECHCLSNYTGLRCEITNTKSMTPTQSNRAAIITGATVGSAIVLLLLIALVVIIAVNMVIHVHKSKNQRLKVSPSQQFENQIQLQNVTKSLGAPPPDEQILPTEAC